MNKEKDLMQLRKKKFQNNETLQQKSPCWMPAIMKKSSTLISTK